MSPVLLTTRPEVFEPPVAVVLVAVLPPVVAGLVSFIVLDELVLVELGLVVLVVDGVVELELF